eukprot:Hpha_TRINITY_DN33981_c0_g1::TRINITY_DN33981_c0_g1_i1::g.69526::m.69526
MSGATPRTEKSTPATIPPQSTVAFPPVVVADGEATTVLTAPPTTTVPVPKRHSGSTARCSDAGVLDQLQKELEQQSDKGRLELARSLCDCHDILLRIDDVARDVVMARPHELTEDRRAAWARRLKELTADCRQKITEIESPTTGGIPSDVRSLSLLSTGQLEHARRLHSNLMAALQNDEACRAGTLLPRPERASEPAFPPSPVRERAQNFGGQALPPQAGLAVLVPQPPSTSRRRSAREKDNQAGNGPNMLGTMSTFKSWKAQNTPVPPPANGPSPSQAANGPTPRKRRGESPSPLRALSGNGPPIANQPMTPEFLPALHFSKALMDSGGFGQSFRQMTAGLTLPEDSLSLTQAQSLAAGLYLVTEALMDEAKAERAMIFRYQATRDELVAVSCAGSSVPRAGQLRMASNHGLIGSVFTSQVGISVSSGSATRDWLGFKADKVVSLLALPVWSTTNKAVTCGVAVVMNKHRGKSPFTPPDETVLASKLPIVAYFLERYPVELNPFDPSILHSLVPLRPAEVPTRMVGHRGVEMHEPRHLIYRTREFGMYMRDQTIRAKAEDVGTPTGLHEVVSYIQSLEECWDASVRAHLEVEDSVNMHLEQARVMREQVKKKAKKIAMLKDLVKSHSDENVRLAAEIKMLSQGIFRHPLPS